MKQNVEWGIQYLFHSPRSQTAQQVQAQAQAQAQAQEAKLRWVEGHRDSHPTSQKARFVTMRCNF